VAQGSRAEKVWEIEFHLSTRSAGTGSGRGQLPPAGPTFVIDSFFSGRYVPSWLFGDGAGILNANLALNRFTGRILPLDTVLTEDSATVGGGPAFGARVTRNLTARWALEFLMEVSPRALELPDATLSDMTSTELSIENAMGQLMSAIGDGRSVAASISTASSKVQVMIGGDVRMRLRPHASWGPYVLAGGGLLLQSSGTLDATVTVDYSFTQKLFPIPIRERDIAVVHYRSPNTGFVHLGFGVLRNLGQRVGLRGEFGTVLASNSVETTVNTTPQSTVGTPTGVVLAPALSNTIRFSTTPGTPSSLSQALTAFQTFSGQGWRPQLAVSGGVYVRF
jgi:hypothetical protein